MIAMRFKCKQKQEYELSQPILGAQEGNFHAQPQYASMQENTNAYNMHTRIHTGHAALTHV